MHGFKDEEDVGSVSETVNFSLNCLSRASDNGFIPSTKSQSIPHLSCCYFQSADIQTSFKCFSNFKMNFLYCYIYSVGLYLAIDGMKL